MRPIDADKLKAVLENMLVHTEQDKTMMADALSVFLSFAMEIVDNQPTIASPPNDPLTLEELREMDGEPVWIERCGSDSPEDREWALVFVEGGFCRTSVGNIAFFALYGMGWRAYRRKPEDVPDSSTGRSERDE